MDTYVPFLLRNRKHISSKGKSDRYSSGLFYYHKLSKLFHPTIYQAFAYSLQ